jgi:hypothetical protein
MKAEAIKNGLGDGARILALCEPQLAARLQAIAQRRGAPSEVRPISIKRLVSVIERVAHSHNRHPPSRLSKLHGEWLRSGNPLFAWEAMRFCAETKCAFPDWVSEYLGDCANRMPPDAKNLDVRKMLPSVLGFPRKRGPRKACSLGDDMAAAEQFLLAHVFAYAIEQGCSPTRATAEAASLLGRDYADRDERTLMALIARHFNLAKVPRSRAAWTQALLRAFRGN